MSDVSGSDGTGSTAGRGDMPEAEHGEMDHHQLVPIVSLATV